MTEPRFRTRLAACEADIRAAQALRYSVFVDELGAGGTEVDHAARREADAHDGFADHLLLEDMSRPENARVVGTYRLLQGNQAMAAGGFYSAAEFDLSPLEQSGLSLLELGRSCLHPAYRGGPAMLHLWHALSEIVETRNIDVLFGVASFHGTDLRRIAAPLSYLHHYHRAPTRLRVQSHENAALPAMLPRESIDRRAALTAMPALIKAYLRMGAVAGDGVFVDRDFNTVDVALIADVRARRRAGSAGASSL